MSVATKSRILIPKLFPQPPHKLWRSLLQPQSHSLKSTLLLSSRQGFQNFPVIQISRRGDTEHKVISIEEILGKSRKKIPLRDLKILYKGEKLNQFAILPRPGADCYIIGLENLRLICWKDSCILLDQDSKIHKQFLANITDSLSNGSQISDEWNSVRKIYQPSSEPEPMEFEQLVLESALSVTLAKFERHMALLNPAVELLLHQISADPNSIMLRRMLAVKKSLGDFENNVLNVTKIIQGLLNNDEDLVGLYLTNTQRKVDEHAEVELLLEFYLADLEEILNQIKSIKDTIEDTNHFVGAHLDSLRNRMIRMSLFMEMGTLSLASGALVAGIFGMNLTHGLESNELSFFVTCGAVSVMMITIFTRFRMHYRKLWMDTTNAHSFKVLKNFLTYVDDLEDLVTEQEITQAEFQAVLDKMSGYKVPAEESDFIFQMFDKDKDKRININTELKL